MSQSDVLRVVATFAELVSEVREANVLWPLMLQELQRAIGFDGGYVAASWGTATEGRAAILEHDELVLRANFERFHSEFTYDEVRAYSERACVHHEVWPSARRERLTVFNELLRPAGVRHMIVRVGYRDGNIYGCNLERRGAGIDFSDRDCAMVDAVAPFLQIAEQLSLARQDESRFAWFAERYALTKREVEFTKLACKGLQNADIALIYGLSSNTVRNTLARVFEKAQVSSRLELHYLVNQSAVEAAARGEGDRRSRGSFVTAVRVASERSRRHSEGRADITGTAPSSIKYSPPST